MEHLTFALARHEDIPEIVAVYRSLIGTPGCTWNMDYPDERNALEDIEGNALFLLKDGGRIVAAASAGALDELGHLPWKPKNPCELARIGVVPDWQGRGVGTLMLRKIIEERDRGAAVLLVSTELDEIMELSDRIMVLYEGRVMAILKADATTREDVGLLMAGTVPG